MSSTIQYIAQIKEIDAIGIELDNKIKTLNDNKAIDDNIIFNESNSTTQQINSRISEEKKAVWQSVSYTKHAIGIVSSYVTSMQLAVNTREKNRTRTILPQLYKIEYLKSQADQILDKSFTSYFKRLLHIGGYSLFNMGTKFYQESHGYLAYLKGFEELLNNDAQNDCKVLSDQEQNELATARAEIERQRKKIEDEYAHNLEVLKQEKDEFLNSEKIKLLGANVVETLDILNASSKEWTSYTPPAKLPEELLIGRIACDLKSDMKQEIKEQLSDIYIGDEIVLPYVITSSSPALFIFEFSTYTRTQIMTGLQSVIYKLVQTMPLNSVNLTYIDPIDRGSNLGSLLRLLDIPGSELCPKVYTSKDDIRKQLHVLEKFVDNTSAKLQGKGTVFTHNQNKIKIPYNWLIINDFPEGFETPSIDSLKVLLNNAEKCGISIIFVCHEKDSDAIAELISSTQNEGFRIINSSVEIDKEKYKFNLYNPKESDESFLDLFVDACKNSLFVDNSFKKVAPVYEFATSNASSGIKIPFAIDENNLPYSFELGTASTTNAFISGEIGSGKSTMLHSIISGITMNYSPDEVELWLVDYKKAEFAEYIKNPIPHVSLIGLERTKEFTYNLLDRLYDEFTSRMKLFASSKVQDLKGYYELRKKDPAKYKPLPRIVLIIDEFHVLCQNILDEQEYKIKLENALSEYRALGLSCILCDQSVTDGLRGLTAKGLKQISVRMAMRNSMDEINETLAIDSSLKNDKYLRFARTLNTGDVMLKTMEISPRGERIAEIKKMRVVNISSQDRDHYIPALRKYWKSKCKQKELIVVDANSRTDRDKKDKKKYDTTHKKASDTIRLYLGKPASFDACFAIDLALKAEDNLIISGGNSELRFSVLAHSVMSVAEANDAKVYFFADLSGETVRNYYEIVEQFKKQLKNKFMLIDNANKTSKVTYQLLERIKKGEQQNAIAVFSGLEEMSDVFDEMPMPPSDKAKKNTNSISTSTDDIMQKIKNAKLEMSVEEDTESDTLAFNAKPIIAELVSRGSRLGLHCIFDLPTIRDLEKMRDIKLEKFKHKIAFIMNEDDSREFLGKSKYITSIDAKEIEISGVYSNGNKQDIVRPYLLPDKDKLNKLLEE